IWTIRGSGIQKNWFSIHHYDREFGGQLSWIGNSDLEKGLVAIGYAHFIRLYPGCPGEANKRTRDFVPKAFLFAQDRFHGTFLFIILVRGFILYLTFVVQVFDLLDIGINF